MNYTKLIEENKDQFNDWKQLDDFISNYEDENNEPDSLEDNITEYADGLCPIYYNEIVSEWQENADARGLADEQGLIENTKDPYKIMTADLYCYYDQQLREDYNDFINLL